MQDDNSFLIGIGLFLAFVLTIGFLAWLGIIPTGRDKETRKDPAKARSRASASAPVSERKSRVQQEREDFHAMPPVLSSWPPGYECKRLEKTRDGWNVHFGRTNSHVVLAIARLEPRTTGFAVDGRMVQVNGGRARS